MKFSIIINTLNRAEYLDRALMSLGYLDYPDFEVIVVNGPSNDRTDDILRKYQGKIKCRSCPLPNLSISRNIGIEAASGDVVAFMDDDAVPEVQWLTELAPYYNDADVGGVGGPVFDHTGYSYQCKYIVCDRRGDAFFFNDNPDKIYNIPGNRRCVSMIGTNSSFRRSLLLEIGGFDEEYEYFLDETDVCLRMIDHGYKIVFSPKALIHHKYAPSHIRTEDKIIRNWYPILKNKIYFSLRNSLNTQARQEVMAWVEEMRKRFAEDDREYLFDRRRLTEGEFERSKKEIERAISDGVTRGGSREPRKTLPRSLETKKDPFHQFPSFSYIGKKLRIAIISRDFPPNFNGGIARFCCDLAYAFGSQGHDVHVIAEGKDWSTVDFTSGYWIHRILKAKEGLRQIGDDEPVAPPVISQWTAAVKAEIARLSLSKAFDIIYTPIWDVEGLDCTLDLDVPVITWLQTSYKIAEDTHPEWKDNPHYYEHHIQKLIECERRLLDRSAGVHGISQGIVEEFSRRYGYSFDSKKLTIIKIGLRDIARDSAPKNKQLASKQVTGLFVGRLEQRKGIDLLLAALLTALKLHKNLEFIVAGDDTLDFPGLNQPIRTWFQENHPDYAGRVRFVGKVPDRELFDLYGACDFFVAPSRFESFGLIFVEAMMFGKPVIGTKVGGIPEIVSDGLNGLLVPPEDVVALGNAISRLTADADLRRRMGVCSRKMFLEEFAIEKVSERLSEYFLGFTEHKLNVLPPGRESAV